MKLLRLPLLAATLASLPAVAQPTSTEVVAAPSSYALPRLSLEQLEQLLGPIALYPDALIALILPASTVPTDLVLAARQLRDAPNDRSQIEHRSWDESVKSLTNYPELVQWLDENLPWTKQVGEAFLAQPAEVMQTIQKLRNQARAAGTLVDTPQQQIVTEANIVRIVPAQPDIIYVPRYEPEVVFVSQPLYSRPFITFGLGVGVGSWLAYDCDWNRNTLWVASRHRPWSRPDWRRPLLPIAPSYTHVPPPGLRPWRPPVAYAPRASSHVHPQPTRTTIVRPAPLGYSRSSSHHASPPHPSAPVPSARSYAQSYSHSYSSSSRYSPREPSPAQGNANPQRGIAPEPSAATRTYARSTLPTVGPRFVNPPAPAPLHTPPPLATSASPATPSGRTYSGNRHGTSQPAPDHSGRPRTFERSVPAMGPQPAMGPMPATRPSANPTLGQPASNHSPGQSRSHRGQPAPAAPVASAEAAPAPANPELGQPPSRGRSGGENSNTNSSGRNWNRNGR